jgi:hypothetical protein
MNDRLEIASKVLAGLVANPETRLSDTLLLEHSMSLATALLAADKENPTTPDDDTAKKARAWDILAREHGRTDSGCVLYIARANRPGTYPLNPAELLAAVLALDKEAHGE